MLLSQFRDEQSCGNTVSCLKKRRAGGVKVSTVKQNAGAASRPVMGGCLF
ncbi:hypothetical protein RLPCCGM1_p1513 [Rhizobium leguminosarum bv. phaseoli CCGM1]|nr:hypothetical protein RLPCCGM1_p1513 [Rhizobium leguminosarum bv. phaseoli CCGM1]